MISTSKQTALALIVANLLPLFGIIFLNWDPTNILFLYWFENIVVGFYTILKIKKSTKMSENYEMTINGKKKKFESLQELKRYIIPFFFMHYGLFTLVHGVFVLSIFGLPNLAFVGLLIVAISLTLSHGLSFYKNFVENEEYKTKDPVTLMFYPYKRIFIIHIAILLGAFLLMGSNKSVWGAIILIGLKIAIDLLLHNVSHRIKPSKVDIRL